jgi:histidinol-phosphate aminotransferase
MTKFDSSIVRDEIRALSAYHVPDAQGYIKLDAMENPYHWPEELVERWLHRIRDLPLNRYPDPSTATLKQMLRRTMQVPAGAELVLGNGSDELIQMIMMIVSGSDRSVLSVEPGFVMYKMIATFLGMPYVGVDLKDDFSLDMDAMLSAITRHKPVVIFLAYPNNPTGNLFSREDIDTIIEAAPGLVVIDEAYHSFARETYMTSLESQPNVLVMRTVSKMGLAGLRLGLLAGAPAWLNEIEKVRLPYNINVLTQESAVFALENQPVLDDQTSQIVGDREILLHKLQAIAGLEVFPSQANFVLFRTPEGQADKIFTELKEQKVLIKNLSPAGGQLKDCLRVTVGTPRENEVFLKQLRDIMHK